MRNQIAGPLICILGLLRLLISSEKVDESPDFYSEYSYLLIWALLCHRILWIPLFTLSLKWPKLCRAFHLYEVVALFFDGVLAFNRAESQRTSNFILLYLLLINALTFAALYYNFWLSLLALAVQISVIQIICFLSCPRDVLPESQVFVAFFVIEIIFVLVLHLMITRIGFWFVASTVKIES